LAKVKSSELSVQTELGELSPLLAGIPKITPYSVPPLYFEQNVNNLPVFTEEAESPLLTTIGKNLPYEVPQGYFEHLPQQVLAQVSPTKTKVVPLFGRTWMRVASAAVIGGALFIAGYQYFGNRTEMVAKNPDSTQTTVARQSPVVEQEINKLSTKDLEEFIREVQVPLNKDVKEPVIASKKNEIKELLRDISDTEIESFLSDMSAGDELFVTD
jgi:hypothetical protein